MKPRRFITYIRLAQRLRVMKVNDYGTVATFLLTAFRLRKGIIRALDVESAGLCQQGQFSIFRDNMIKLGWLERNLAKAEFTKKFDVYEPGFRLKPFLEEEEAYHAGVPKTVKELQEKYVSKEISDAIARERDLYKDLCEQYKQQIKG